MQIKALSLTQPWATLVALGAKTIETRSWGTSYRGWVAIHASKGFPPWARDYVGMEPFVTALAGREVDALPLGAIVALARLRACWGMAGVDTRERLIITDRRACIGLTPEEYAFGNYAPGRYGWEFADVRPLATPLPCRGALGLWDPPPAVLAQLQGVLAHA